MQSPDCGRLHEISAAQKKKTVKSSANFQWTIFLERRVEINFTENLKKIFFFQGDDVDMKLCYVCTEGRPPKVANPVEGVDLTVNGICIEKRGRLRPDKDSFKCFANKIWGFFQTFSRNMH